MSSNKFFQAASGNAAAGGGSSVTDAQYVEELFSTHLFLGNGTTLDINNGIALSGNSSLGSVYFDGSGDSVSIPSHSNFGYSTSDFTVEFWVKKSSNPSGDAGLVEQRPANTNGDYLLIGLNSSGQVFVYVNSAMKISPSADTALDADVWYHIAYVRDYTRLGALFINGKRVGSWADTTTYAQSGFTLGTHAFGAADFHGYMSNLRVTTDTLLYTSNFNSRNGELTNSGTKTKLLCLQGSTPFTDNSGNSHTVTANGNASASSESPFSEIIGRGGLVWARDRDNASNNEMMDTERGTSVAIFSDLNNGNFTKTNGVVSFNTDGFTIGSNAGWNANSSMSTWTFAKHKRFFDIQTYAGNGVAGRTISHDLQSVPGCVIVKRLDTTSDWPVYHRGANAGTTPENYRSLTNGSNGFSSTNNWNDTAPTSTTVTLGSSTDVNGSGANYVMYLFAHNDSDGGFGVNSDQDIIKCGHYIGNGSSSGPVVDLGFEPQWVMIKSEENGSTGHWNTFDNMRGVPANDVDRYLAWNSSAAEGAIYDSLDFTGSGFKINAEHAYINTNTQPYVYIAIRRGPMAVPTSNERLFQIQVPDFNRNSDLIGPYWSLRAPVDLALHRQNANNTETDGITFIDRKRYGNLNILNTLTATSNASEATVNSNSNPNFFSTRLFLDNNLGLQSTAGYGSTTPDLAYLFSRAPNHFDIQTYDGTGSNYNHPHQLGVVPEMMWVKNRTGTDDWQVYHKDLGNGAKIILNSNDTANTSSSLWNYTTPTSTTFRVANNSKVNGAGNAYVNYLFATLDGLTKVGSFSHTSGSTTNVDCGFSNGAKFIVWKSTDYANSWGIFDSEFLGINALGTNDPYLVLNNTDGYNNNYDVLGPYSPGFTVGNIMGTGTYIFWAVAA